MRRRSGTRALAAVLFTDIVDSSAVASRVGDTRWKELIARHHAIVRRELKRFGGRELDTAGDGFFASFKEPAAALRCACAVSEAIRELGIEIRAGVHFGECEQVGDKLGGIAVVVGARVMSLGGAGDVLVTATTSALVAGAGFGFQDQGSHVLKGVDGEWHVVSVTEVDGEPRAKPAATEEAKQRLAAVQPSALLSRGWFASRPWAVGVGIALVLALIAISIPLLRSGNGAFDAEANSIARIDAGDGSLQLATPLGERPGASAIGFGSLWIAQPDRGTVARLELSNGSVVDTIPVGNSPSGIAVGEGSVWVTNAADGTVSRISPDANEETTTFEVGGGPTGIAVGDGVLWVADTIGGRLLRVNPTSEKSDPIPLAGAPSGVAFTPEGVWVSIAPTWVGRVDPEDLSVTLRQSVGNGPTAVLSAFGSIWVTNQLDGTVSRLEPSTGRVLATIPVGASLNALGAAAGSVWVANGLDDSVSSIDPITTTVAQTVPIGGVAASLAADGDELWLAVGASAAEHRGGTLTVSSTDAAFNATPTSLDPAVVVYNDTIGGQILAITNDGLLGYRKVGGLGGATLVPDLASALPQVSDDGLTYRLPLRGGIRYSTGEPVRPEDFRYAIERAILMNEGSYFDAIIGANACTGRPTCDLRDSIVIDEGSVTFRLAVPDPDLPFKLALPVAYPVPVGTPFEDQGYEPLPATGPYMIAEAGADGIELVRNPEFKEWSADAQPDGFVDMISWRFGEELASAFDQLSAGELDWMTDAPLPEDLASLQAAHPDQVELWPLPGTYYLGFDVRKPPFNDERVRKALNFAIDRDRVVELLGGPTSHRSTCQILPPGFQGYEPFCPYTLEPDSGVWSAPDLGQAQALIEEAGAKGERVVAWVGDDPGFQDAMEYVVRVMNQIGLRARLDVVHEAKDEYSHGIYAGVPQAYAFGWGANIPTPGDFIGGTLFRCDGVDNVSGFCSKSLDTRMDEALRLQATDLAAASQAWIEIDRRLVEDAVWAPLTNPVSAFAVSERMENVQVHPRWGILVSRVWVR